MTRQLIFLTPAQEKERAETASSIAGEWVKGFRQAAVYGVYGDAGLAFAVYASLECMAPTEADAFRNHLLGVAPGAPLVLKPAGNKTADPLTAAAFNTYVASSKQEPPPGVDRPTPPLFSECPSLQPITAAKYPMSKAYDALASITDREK